MRNENERYRRMQESEERRRAVEAERKLAREAMIKTHQLENDKNFIAPALSMDADGFITGGHSD